MADGHVLVRPSGTEPKLKCYLEYISNDDADGAAQVLARTESALRSALGL
jgi:phosphomannomutase